MVLHEVPPGSTWDITRETAGYHLPADIAFETSTRTITPACSSPAASPRIPATIDPRAFGGSLGTSSRSTSPSRRVCHGIEIAAAAGCLKGAPRRLRWRSCALDITQVGGTYVNQPVVVDGNFVTASRLDGQHAVPERVLKLLKASVPM